MSLPITTLSFCRFCSACTNFFLTIQCQGLSYIFLLVRYLLPQLTAVHLLNVAPICVCKNDFAITDIARLLKHYISSPPQKRSFAQIIILADQMLHHPVRQLLKMVTTIAAEKLLDHNDGQLAELAPGRIRGRKNRTKLNTRTDRLVKTPNLSGMLPFYSYSANCVAHLQTGSHLDPLLHLASDSQSHSMAAPVLL
ncbi:hypothetical protein T10_4798 [Trichinella papuae]|uniref:Uncharacterized protein n=1 Tax=Trichinella papuae TaxID=268474 RepID=A0A0V1MXA3_9BILA|nr:hypothetical protein T10_4798 [Trichinella papuae]